MKSFLIYIVTIPLLLLASCHSKKSVSISEQTRYDTTAVRNGSAETAISVSVLRELAADMDSVEIYFHPFYDDTSIDRGGIDSSVIKRIPGFIRDQPYSFPLCSTTGIGLIKAKRLSLNDRGKAETASASRALQHDSIQSSAKSDIEENTAVEDTKVAEPADNTWMFIVFCIAAGIMLYFQHKG